MDVYNGCKHKHCDARSGLSRFAVDGAYSTCFVSLTEHSPWFVVHLYHYHPISLINVYNRHRFQLEVMMVLIGNGCCKLYYCNEVTIKKTKTKQPLRTCKVVTNVYYFKVGKRRIAQ